MRRTAAKVHYACRILTTDLGFHTLLRTQSGMLVCYTTVPHRRQSAFCMSNLGRRRWIPCFTADPAVDACLLDKCAPYSCQNARWPTLDSIPYCGPSLGCLLAGRLCVAQLLECTLHVACWPPTFDSTPYRGPCLGCLLVGQSCAAQLPECTLRVERILGCSVAGQLCAAPLECTLHVEPWPPTLDSVPDCGHSLGCLFVGQLLRTQSRMLACYTTVRRTTARVIVHAEFGFHSLLRTQSGMRDARLLDNRGRIAAKMHFACRILATDDTLWSKRDVCLLPPTLGSIPYCGPSLECVLAGILCRCQNATCM